MDKFEYFQRILDDDSIPDKSMFFKYEQLLKDRIQAVLDIITDDCEIHIKRNVILINDVPTWERNPKEGVT